MADRETLAKADAAARHLGERGIGYCLIDQSGFGLEELRALKPDDEFRQGLEKLLRPNGIVKRKEFEQTFDGERRQWAYDQLQSLVLREGMRYETRLVGRPETPTHYFFDFRLRA